MHGLRGRLRSGCLHLGKVTLYQLSYAQVLSGIVEEGGGIEPLAIATDGFQDRLLP